MGSAKAHNVTLRPYSVGQSNTSMVHSRCRQKVQSRATAMLYGICHRSCRNPSAPVEGRLHLKALDQDSFTEIAISVSCHSAVQLRHQEVTTCGESGYAKVPTHTEVDTLLRSAAVCWRNASFDRLFLELSSVWLVDKKMELMAKQNLQAF